MSLTSSLDLNPQTRAGFDAIIDVRSPAEFAQDQIPGAINLPVLDDAERAEIGTIYVQTSKFLARRLGAAKVARNIASHLDGPLSDRDGSFQALVYCWRGGQRSGAMVTVMHQVGWRVTQLEGGYQTWRRRVSDSLYPSDDTLTEMKLILLDGPTGVGKTETLHLLAERGVQTLDLEGLANHRGSLFGARPGGQPAQKLFESRLFVALEALDLSRPIMVEAESSRIGDRTLPPGLWSAMKAAPRLALEASPADRVAHILDRYADIAADADALNAVIGKMPQRLGRATVAHWRAMAQVGQIAELVGELLEVHYDPAYRRMSQRFQPSLGAVAAPALIGDPSERGRVLDRIAAMAE